ncbi:MAG: hypothetical protein Q8N55_04715 [bacterium]|nr:hypothetical protein [bacterium]
MANGTTTQVNQRLQIVEKDISLLKKTFFAFLSSLPRKITFQNDEQVWKAIKNDYEEIQEKIFKKTYPGLYGKLKQQNLY